MYSSVQLEEMAADWLARRDSDRWCAADEAALIAWLEQSTAHRVAYVRLESAWRLVSQLKETDCATRD